MPKKTTTTTPKVPATTGTKIADESLETVTKDFKTSWDYCASAWHDRWTNNLKLYHNQRTKRGYDGITDTFVPMVFGTVETLTSALFGAKPKFNYMPPHENREQNTDILNALLDFYWEKDQWSIKVIDTGREMLQLGTSIDYFYWMNDHPCMIHVPLRDFFIDPTSTSIETARYMGRRYLTTLDELKSFEVIDLDKPITQPATPTDPETPQDTMMEGGQEEIVGYEMKPKYKNLDQLEKASSTTKGGESSAAAGGQDKTDKQAKDELYGSTLPDDNDDQIEILEYWTKDRIISIANRKVKIEDSENYYKAKARDNGEEYPQGIMPFAACRDYVDPSLFYATSEVDVIADEQELLNDITNQNIDSVTYTLNQMYTLDPAYAEHIEDVENLPGAVYPFPKDALMPIQQRPIPPDAFQERLNIKNEIRETTAVNEVVKGVGEQQGGKSTATEINAQIAGAGQRINLKITQLENEYFHRVARIVFAMIKLYVTEPMMVRIMGKDGADWQQFDPAEFQGQYEPRVQLDIAIQNKKQEQAAQAKELLAAFLNDPEVNQQELKKLVLSRSFDLEPDEVSLLLQPDPMQQQMAMMMQGGGMGQPGQPGAPAGPGGAPGGPSAPPAPEDNLMPTIHGGQGAPPAPAMPPQGPPPPDASQVPADPLAGLPPELIAQLAGIHGQ